MANYNPAIGDYAGQLALKEQRARTLFTEFDAPELEVHASPKTGFRMRAEFRVWHEGGDLFYAMFDPQDRKTPLRVVDFPIVAERIQKAMPILLSQVRGDDEMRRKLFQVEFLSTLSGELLVTLIYHRQLSGAWDESARALALILNAKVIGRARKLRRVLDEDYVEEHLQLTRSVFGYRQFEQGFTQPNAAVNIKMMDWACDAANGSDGDLLELYCGNGNFTLPLSRHFRYVLATEVSKAPMRAARHNANINAVNNVELVRLSAEEVCQALTGEREFRRLKDVRPLSEYQFSTIFVNPPRAGLDPMTEKLVAEFDNIIYVSCNPETLRANLQVITKTHRISRCALFDQFPYTNHMECGVYLRR